MKSQEFLDAVGFRERLEADLSKCCFFTCVVSYVLNSGIKPLLKLKRSVASKSIVYTCDDFGITEPEALQKLVEHGYQVKCYGKTGLHAKAWILYFKDKQNIIYLGSSNLSEAATSSNIEANARIKDMLFVKSVESWLTSICTIDQFFTVDSNWIMEYSNRRIKPLPINNSSDSVTIETSDLPAKSSWQKKIGRKLFLSQSIPVVIKPTVNLPDNQSSDDDACFEIRLVLLTKKGKLYDDKATVNRKNYQLSVGRKYIMQWITACWDFDAFASHAKYEEDRHGWEKWFRSTGRSFPEFQYEISISENTTLPTVWLRPRLA